MGPRTNPYIYSFYLFCVYVDDVVMWSDWGWRLGAGANFYFS